MKDANKTKNQLIEELKELRQRIDDPKHLETKLQQIMTAVESTSDAIGISDVQGRHFYQNKALTKLFGYETAEELQAAGGGKAVVRDPSVAKEMFDNIQSGKPWIGELDMQTKDGRVFPAFERANPIYDDSGNIVGLIGIITDITDRKKAEEELTRSNQLLITIETRANIGAWKFDVQTLIQTWSEQTFKILEVDTSTGEPKVPEGVEFINPPYREQAEIAIDKAIKYGEPYDQEWEITTSKGNTKWVQSICSPIQVDGKTASLSGSFQDITERKHAEVALRESEDKYRTIVETTAEWIWEIDLAGRHTFSNPAVTAILGYRPEELIGKSAASLMHPQDWAEVEAKLPLLVSEKRGWKGWILRWRHKNGTYRFLESNAKPVSDQGGSIKGYRGADRDITERKLAEVHASLVAEIQSFLLRSCRLVDIYSLVSEKIYELIGDCITATSILDEHQQTVRMAAYHGIEIPFENIISTLGMDALQKVIPLSDMTEDDLRIYRSGKLEKLEGGLYALIAGLAPKTACLIVEKMLRIRTTYTMGFIHGNEHLGGLIILARSDISSHIATIEQIVNLATIAIERKLAEEALRESEEIFARFMERSPIHVFIKDENARAVRLSKNYEEMLGKPVAEVLGKSMDDLFPSELAKRMVADDMRILREGEEFTVEEELHGRIYSTVKFPIHIGGKPRYLAGFSMDITERKQAEEKLRQSEEKYRALFNTFPIGVTVSDHTGKIVESNVTAEKLLGISKEEQEKRHINGQEWHMIRPDGTPMPSDEYASVRALKENQRVENVEMGIVKPNDDVTWINVSATPLNLENYGVVITYGDVTERKRAEDALRASQNNLKKAQELSHVGHWGVDIASQEVTGSDELFRIFGLSPDELTLEAFIEIVHPEDRDLDLSHIKRGMEYGEPWDIEHRLLLKDGTLKWIRAIGNATKDDNGKLVAIIGVVQDITERRHAEEELRESGRRFRILADESPQAIYETDVKGDCIYVNKKWCEFAGMTAVEAMGQGWQRGLHPDDHQWIFSLWREHAIGGKPWSFEYRFITPKGKVTWVYGTTQQLADGTGAITGYIGVNVDITERKRAEEALRQSETSHKIILQTALDGFWLVNMQRQLVDVNDAYCQMSGYSKQELLTMSIPDIEVVERSEVAEARIKELMTEGGLRFESQHRRKDGKVFDVEVSVKHQPAEKQMVAFIRDITERKQAEKDLKESEEKFKALFELSPNAIMLSNAAGNISDVNHTMAEITGYTEEEIKTLGGAKIIAPEVLEATLRDWTKQVEEEGRFIVETLWVGNDGQRIPVAVLGKTIEINGKEMLEVIATDITERRKSEESLRESEARWQFAVDGSALGLWDWNIQTSEVFFSKQWKAMLGFEEDEISGSLKEWDSRIHPDDKEEVYADVYKHLDGNAEFYNNEHRVLCKDNSYKWILDRGKLVSRTGNGKPLRMIGTHTDITERKQLEEEQAKANKLESIGLLAGGIAHDFNNILAVILGNTSLAKISLDNKEETVKLLTETENATVRATKLTMQLLTFAKGGAPVKEIAELTELTRETTQFSLRGSNVHYRTSISPDLWTAEVDKGQISQVIGNLVINAQQAMPEGGTIDITAKNVTVTPEDNLPLQKGNYVEISLEDKGHGIPAEHLTKIFDPYFTTKQKGSGLGLATVYSIIHRHDGHISVESKVGVGTTFHIYLPASSKQIERKDAGKEESTVLTGKILVMDDEDSVRKFVLVALRSFGNDVDEASDGAEAIEKYKKAMKTKKPFDVVIMDLTVPGGMGGQVAIKKLLEVDPNAKAVVSSGYGNDPVVSNFEAYGFKNYISKPYKIDELRKVLNEVLS